MGNSHHHLWHPAGEVTLPSVTLLLFLARNVVNAKLVPLLSLRKPTLIGSAGRRDGAPVRDRAREDAAHLSDRQIHRTREARVLKRQRDRPARDGNWTIAVAVGLPPVRFALNVLYSARLTGKSVPM